MTSFAEQRNNRRGGGAHRRYYETIWWVKARKANALLCPGSVAKIEVDSIVATVQSNRLRPNYTDLPKGGGTDYIIATSGEAIQITFT